MSGLTYFLFAMFFIGFTYSFVNGAEADGIPCSTKDICEGLCGGNWCDGTCYKKTGANPCNTPTSFDASTGRGLECGDPYWKEEVTGALTTESYTCNSGLKMPDEWKTTSFDISSVTPSPYHEAVVGMITINYAWGGYGDYVSTIEYRRVSDNYLISKWSKTYSDPGVGNAYTYKWVNIIGYVPCEVTGNGNYNAMFTVTRGGVQLYSKQIDFTVSGIGQPFSSNPFSLKVNPDKVNSGENINIEITACGKNSNDPGLTTGQNAGVSQLHYSRDGIWKDYCYCGSTSKPCSGYFVSFCTNKWTVSESGDGKYTYGGYVFDKNLAGYGTIPSSMDVTVGPDCTGTVSLSLSPSTVNTEKSFTASVSGLSSCDGEPADFYIFDTAEWKSCTISGSGCSISLTAPSTAGSYNYGAGVDKNSNGDFNDGGEWDTKTLTVTTPDTTPPVRSNESPTGTITTSSTTLSLTTNEAATCKYSTTAGTNYDSMTNTFSTTGSTSHSQVLFGLSEGTKNYYVRCMDMVGNKNTNDYTITFAVDTIPPTTSFSSVAGDTSSPYWDNSNDAQTDIVISGESGMSCRWGTTDVPYSSMSNGCSVSGSTATCYLGSLSQSSSHTRYVSCKDSAGNEQSSSQNLDVLFGVDWTNPSVGSISPTSAIVDQAVTFTTTVSDATSGISNCWFHSPNTPGGTVVNQGVMTVSGTTASKTHTFTSAGSYSVYAYCQDNGGNTAQGSSVSVSAKYDTQITDFSFTPTTITLGQQIEARGWLKTSWGAGIGGETINLRVYNPSTGLWDFVKSGTTESTGSNTGYVAFFWTPVSSYVGTKDYRLEFAGDVNYEESWSGIVSLTVSPAPATIYEDISYGGASLAVTSDIPSLSVLSGPCGWFSNTWNDCISSIKVTPGYALVLYKDANYQGSFVVKTSDDSSLVDDVFNDMVSSIQVVSGVCPIDVGTTDLAGNVMVKRTTDSVYSPTATVKTGSQVDIMMEGTVTTTEREMYALGIKYKDTTGDGVNDWEYCCCGNLCMAAVAKCHYTPSTGYCNIASAASCSNVWATSSLSLGTYTYEGVAYDYKPSTGGEVKSSQTASVNVVECITDGDCEYTADHIKKRCDSPSGTGNIAPNPYTYTCTYPTTCGIVNANCEPGYCCTGASSPGPGEATGVCVSIGIVRNPYLCS